YRDGGGTAYPRRPGHPLVQNGADDRETLAGLRPPPPPPLPQRGGGGLFFALGFSGYLLRHTEEAMLWSVVGHFWGGNAVPVYRGFREKGRLASDGLRYVNSWVSSDFQRCYQIMECDDPALIERWTANWSDLVEFEVVPVVTSEEAVNAL